MQIPFATRFTITSTVDRRVYVGTLLAAAAVGIGALCGFLWYLPPLRHLRRQ